MYRSQGIGVAGKICSSVVVCGVFVLEVDVKVTREDDAIIGVARVVEYGLVNNTIVLEVNVQVTRDRCGWKNMLQCGRVWCFCA